MSGRPGRPLLRERKNGDRVPLGFRVTLDLKQRLEYASTACGRSQSQEAEIRLERSFHEDEIIARLERIEAVLTQLCSQKD
jgi:hypothetical protein